MARSTPEPVKVFKAKCPICGDQADHGFRPFCSRRCADIDLFKWLSGSCAIAGRADADEDGEDASPAADGATGQRREDDDADG